MGVSRQAQQFAQLLESVTDPPARRRPLGECARLGRRHRNTMPTRLCDIESAASFHSHLARNQGEKAS